MIYLAKGILIFQEKEKAQRWFKKIRWVEMPISLVFFATGIYMLVSLGHPPNYISVKLLLILLAIPLAVIGQKRHKPLFLWISVFILVYIFGVSETRSLNFQKPKIEFLADDGLGENAELIKFGALIYGENCLRCHGQDGDLQRYGAKKLNESILDGDAAMEIIKNGKGSMPAFEGKLDQKELEAVGQFIQRYNVQ